MRRIHALHCTGPAAAILLGLLLAAGPALAAGTATGPGAGPASPPAGTGTMYSDIRDIKGPIEIASGHLPLVLALSAAVILLAGGALLYLRRRRRHGRAPAPAAHEVALARLAQARTLMENGEADEFATVLAGILRSYIEARFHLPARNRTSREFVRALAHDPTVPPLLRQNRDRLREWLHHFDMAKFARSSLSREQMEAMLDAVHDFIVSTRPDNTPAAGVTTPTTAAGTTPPGQEVLQ